MPTATGTPVPSPSVQANPSAGSYGDRIALAGSGFAPGEQVNVYWDTPLTAPITTALTSGNGTFSATVALLAAVQGAHSLTAVGQASGRSASAALQVQPRVYPGLTSGPSGSVTTLTGTGFGPNELVTGWWGSPQGTTLGRTSTTAQGSFGALRPITFTVPNVPPGTYVLGATGAVSGASASTTFLVAGSTVAAVGPHRGLATEHG
jgi:hypothetical protein